MVVIMVLVSVIAFIVIDLGLRLLLQKLRQAKVVKEREAALDMGLKTDFATAEAKSLKRVEVPEPKARILAVDDEPVILDSFRKILVLAGYSIDTVESGPEALGLVQERDYDFVFTDLKMPEMDGLEVTMAVKKLRPDIDVIIITGYATVESAVSAMKFGSMDYVEKPFTEDELVQFVNASLYRRQDRIERQLTPKVHLVTPSAGKSDSRHEFNVPLGVFVSPDHTWVDIELNGALRIGIDDFTRKLIGQIDQVLLPKIGLKAERGRPLFSIRQGEREIAVPSPVSGTVTSVNSKLGETPELLNRNPYEHGWICRVEASNLKKELQSMRIGADAISWYQTEIDKFMQLVHEVDEKAPVHRIESPPADRGRRMDDQIWDSFTSSFLHATSSRSRH